jgi:hypothetical protein
MDCRCHTQDAARQLAVHTQCTHLSAHGSCTIAAEADACAAEGHDPGVRLGVLFVLRGFLRETVEMAS